jgi:hypothetical protein
MITPIFAFALAVLGLSSPVLAGEDADRPACDLSLAQVGEALPPNLEASARVRIVRPGQAVTEEFAADRTTILLDAEGVVVAVRCG